MCCPLGLNWKIFISACRQKARGIEEEALGYEIAHLNRSLYTYQFVCADFLAQVTNPAIDSLREGLVMSLEINLGKRENMLDAGPANAAQVGVL